MAGVSWAGRASLLLVVAVTMLAPIPTTSQETEGRRTITNPDWPCGVPWGPNGERPTETPRTKRQIILPDDENYSRYLAEILRTDGSTVGARDRPVVEESPAPEEPEGNQQSLDDAICGTAVISDRFLITAAHCVWNDGISAVRLGALDLNADSSKSATYDIREVIVHRRYQGDTFVRYNDVALLLTYDTIRFNDVVYPYCIPAEPPTPGTIVTASGYGLYNATTRVSHLLETNLTMVDTKECEDEYINNDLEPSLRLKYPILLQNTDMICAIDDVSDACEGDSGGPLVEKRDGKEYLIGLVGAGASCRANSKSILPGLYVNLARHVDFMNAILFGRDPPPPEA